MAANALVRLWAMWGMGKFENNINVSITFSDLEFSKFQIKLKKSHAWEPRILTEHINNNLGFDSPSGIKKYHTFQHENENKVLALAN
jgi:hypothetical protein